MSPIATWLDCNEQSWRCYIRRGACDGKTTEWKSQALRSYQRRTLAADALIAGTYLAGTNTRRVRGALGALFGGAVGKDTVSRVWRKVKSDWDAWNARSLADEPIVRLILDGTVVRVRLDRKATSISLLVVLGVRQDGQKVLAATFQATRSLCYRLRPPTIRPTSSRPTARSRRRATISRCCSGAASCSWPATPPSGSWPTGLSPRARIPTICRSMLKRRQDLASGGHCHTCTAQPVTKIMNRAGGQLRQLTTAEAVLSVKNVVLHATLVDHEHLAGHALVALVSSGAMLQEAFAHIADRHLVGVGSVGAALHLTFNMDAKSIGRLLGGEVLTAPFSTAVSLADLPSSFCLSVCFPSALTNRGHGSNPSSN
jgi:hypothetical protein